MDPQKKWGSQGFGSREEEYAIAWLLHSKVSLDAMLSQGQTCLSKRDVNRCCGGRSSEVR